jgi:hypothetical protein
VPPRLWPTRGSDEHVEADLAPGQTSSGLVPKKGVFRSQSGLGGGLRCSTDIGKPLLTSEE